MHDRFYEIYFQPKDFIKPKEKIEEIIIEESDEFTTEELVNFLTGKKDNNRKQNKLIKKNQAIKQKA
jgi:hypothetical protein